MTVCQRDLTAAKSALEGDAFDLIVTPIVPTDATQTVRLTLWQNKLLKLLTSQERVASQFQQHMEAFPSEPEAEEEVLRLFETIHETLARSLQLLNLSMRNVRCSIWRPSWNAARGGGHWPDSPI